ncbi:hypothetical protein T459_19274 [Capsicum annuum]|uniref:Protein kinase domain-containing protein n=1 Tax=Capsicum annuum TaxID=4072 RepID=A0A2G2Z158_CAPAN|nr:hypothetical protein T459_19274 [Capsicum annuum]
MVRPPKLLLGSTSYGVTADLWSVCCIVAELFFRRPLLKGRTECKIKMTLKPPKIILLYRMPSNLLFLVNGEKIFTVSILQVEKLHKVFKLCGSPLDDYWKRYKLPLATMFKPKKPYYSTLRDRCKELLKSVVKLIETLLSIDPYKRGAASSALNSEVSLIRIGM